MTEAVIDGGVVDSGAPIDVDIATQPTELGAQTPEKAPEPDKPSTSVGDAIRKAQEKIAAKEAAKEPAPKGEPKTEPKAEAPKADAAKEAAKPASEPKPDAKEPQPRENGKFVAKDKPAEQPRPSHTAEDAPARFTQDVKEIWHTLPENARGEVKRMEREFTEGFNKYKAAADRDAGLNEFHDMARQSGKDLRNVVGEYVEMEKLLYREPVKALETIMQRVGISPRQYAEHILNLTPDQQSAQQDQTISELRRELSALKQQIGGVQQTFQQQQETAVTREVNQFKAAHPRFDELSDDIAFFLQTRCPGDLAQAYELAERLNPAPAKPSATADVAAQPRTEPAVNPAGNKSISGAPIGDGSTPKANGPVPSTREALKRAMARVA